MRSTNHSGDLNLRLVSASPAGECSKHSSLPRLPTTIDMRLHPPETQTAGSSTGFLSAVSALEASEYWLSGWPTWREGDEMGFREDERM